MEIKLSVQRQNYFIFCLVVWNVFFTIYNVLRETQNDLNIKEYNNLSHSLIKANNEIKILKQQYIELEQRAFPRSDYEQSRRRIRQNVDHLWRYLSKKLNSPEMQFVNDLRYNLLIDFEILEKRDNQWRRQQRKNFSDFMQKKIQDLQNPKDCKKSKKLVCPVNSAGIGAQLHHAAHCLVAALAMNRSVVFNAEDKLSNDHIIYFWEKFFKPISNTCHDSSGSNETEWKEIEKMRSYEVIHFPVDDYFGPYYDRYFIPLHIPQQISDELITLSGEPYGLFIAQLLKYLMRTSDRMNAFMDEFKKKINFNHPIVGIQVRRTDKLINDAKSHSIDEYMHYVEDFYNKLDLTNERNRVNKTIKRLVYLATDEPQVWKNEIKTYIKKGYDFRGDISLSESNSDPSKRKSFESYQNIIIDALLLSQCDFIVCTFSSNICRLVFELMQTQDSETDLSNAYYSLDQIYCFWGQKFHGKLAIMDHTAQNHMEISFKAGDIIEIMYLNMHNGYYSGIHNNTKKSGLFPTFKVIENVVSVPFDAFENY